MDVCRAVTRSEKTLAFYEGPGFSQWGSDVVHAGLSQDESYLIHKYLGSGEERILEGGCGGGRILLALARKGYRHITGFDFSQRMVEAAAYNFRQAGHAACLCVAEASRLPYAENSFDACVYGGQLLCCLPDEMTRRKALQETFRVMKGEGVALFSVLNYRARRLNLLLNVLLNGSLFRDHADGRYFPSLRRGRRINLGFLSRRQARVYWYLPEEFVYEVCAAGFQAIEITSSTMTPSKYDRRESERTPLRVGQSLNRGRLWVVGRKPAP